MNNIEVAVIDEHGDPAKMMSFLARLTQRGHNIKCMDDIYALMEKPSSDKLIESMMKMENHGTIKRFTPITIAIVGASRRFLAQIRTHSIGLNFVSASLQYSDYSGSADFVVPYALMEADDNLAYEIGMNWANSRVTTYLDSCKASMETYKLLAEETDNDTAGYAAPQGLRNILIIQGNHEAWLHLIKLRACNRNTNETQYVMLRIWEELLKTQDGELMFKYAGADCAYGSCLEGKMCCGNPWKKLVREADESGTALPRHIINEYWPLLKESNSGTV